MENKMPILWKINCRNFWKIVYHSQVNGKEYASLSDAINDSKSGSRIVIHKQISTDDTLIINKDIEIDFNGNSYNYTGNDTAFNILNGTVTITNSNMSSPCYLFKVANNASLKTLSGNYHGCFTNEGTLIVSNGVYNSTGVYETPGSHGDNIIQNYGFCSILGGSFNSSSNIIYNKKTLKIKKGTFTCSNTQYLAIINEKKATVTINGGSFYGHYGVLENYGTATINDAAFYTSVNNEALLAIGNAGKMKIKKIRLKGMIANISGKLEIFGGSFNGLKNSTCLWASGGSVIIKGGNYHAPDNVSLVVEKGSSLTFTGGTVKSCKKYGCLLLAGKAKLKGGKFKSKARTCIGVEKTGKLSIGKKFSYTKKIVYAK